MDSLCHPWFTTTNLSYRFPIFETSATALCGTTGIELWGIGNGWSFCLFLVDLVAVLAPSYLWIASFRTFWGRPWVYGVDSGAGYSVDRWRFLVAKCQARLRTSTVALTKDQCNLKPLTFMAWTTALEPCAVLHVGIPVFHFAKVSIGFLRFKRQGSVACRGSCAIPSCGLGAFYRIAFWPSTGSCLEAREKVALVHFLLFRSCHLKK